MSDSKGVNRLFLILIVVYVGAAFLMSALMPVKMPAYLSIIVAQLLVLLPVLLYCRIRKIAVKELIPFRKISFSTGVLVVVSTYLMYPLMIALNAVTLLFTDSATAQMQVEVSDFNIMISTLLIAVLPACVEEFVFRGVLFQTYRQKRIFSGILLSAFLFGCMHMNLNQFVYAFAMGIYMAFLVEGTGSIISSMLAHFVLNFTGVALTEVLKLMYGRQGMSYVMQQSGRMLQNDRVQVFMMLASIMMWFVIGIGTAVGAVAIFIQICKRSGRWEHMKTIFQKKREESIITIPLALAVAMIAFIIIRTI